MKTAYRAAASLEAGSFFSGSTHDDIVGEDWEVRGVHDRMLDQLLAVVRFRVAFQHQTFLKSSHPEVVNAE